MRKGSEKSRNGCKTCKIRKVKCDEAQPHCRRCTSTGRRCDGYAPVVPGAYSWKQLLNMQPSLLPDLSGDQRRGLAFYREAVAPTLSMSKPFTFWTQQVLQAATLEPTVRNAVLAIGSLVEDLTGPGSSLMRAGFPWMGVVDPERNRLAMRYYNLSIRDLLAPKQQLSTDTVLMVSILFTCVEMLRGNEVAAISHCRHGVNIVNSSSLSSPMSPIFNHLSIFPFFFGHGIFQFPDLDGNSCFDAVVGDATIDPSTPIVEIIDHLMARAARLVRAVGDLRVTRASLADDAYFASMIGLEREQMRLDQRIRDCRPLVFPESAEPVLIALGEAKIRRLVQMRWLVCYIWTASCLDDGESMYDEFMDDFRRLVALAQEEEVAAANQHKKLSKQKGPTFTFEMQFSPLMYFVVMKCRDLRLRIEALRLMRCLSASREALWEADIMVAQGVCIVKAEHKELCAPERGNGSFMPETIVDGPVPIHRRIQVSIMGTEVRSPPSTPIRDLAEAGVAVKQQVIYLYKSGCTTPFIDWVTMPAEELSLDFAELSRERLGLTRVKEK